MLVTLLGCIYVGSQRAFNDIAGSFVILTSLSYLTAILPHLLSRRAHMVPGYFWMNGILGYAVHTASCLYLIIFIVIFSFPSSLPVNVANMNYSSLIVGVLSVFVAGLWLWKRAEYLGPQCLQDREASET